MSVLLAYGTDLFSFVGPTGSVSGWVSVGTAPSGTVLSHNDGILGTFSETAEVTAAFAVDLGASKTPLFAAFFNHNFAAPATARIQASDSPTFSSLIVDVASTLYTSNPHFWKDLRSVTPRTARYWRGYITGNAQTLKLGEFVVGDADAIQSYQWEYVEGRYYLERTFGTTDHGAFHRRKQGIIIRSRAVRWVGPDSVEEILRAVSDRVGVVPGPVVLIPDDADQSDVWFLDWTEDYVTKQIIENRTEVLMTLQEQSPGSRT